MTVSAWLRMVALGEVIGCRGHWVRDDEKDGYLEAVGRGES
jgi:hypothetical protein